MEKRRNLFDEVMEGFEALAQERQGKITLPCHRVAMPDATQVADSLTAADADDAGEDKT